MMGASVFCKYLRRGEAFREHPDFVGAKHSGRKSFLLTNNIISGYTVR